ncbi:Gluconate transport-inducing protein [Basidiobolus ranarum]|uniref:Gluconate transport-inducing protein n=1 Tax=Basidiobolus ranarum TaxID=34480 RepID=A0ABR2VRI4_9FUNG
METYFGYIESVQDALLVFETCRLGHLSRVRRRLSDKERQRIRSGSIYVWEEEESGIRRWTDGYTWSPSRVFGSFLTYQELKSRHKATDVKIPSPALSNSDSELEDGGHRYGFNSCDHPVKENGFIKQSMSVVTASGRKFHMISYYNKDHVASGMLMVPSFDPFFAHIKIPQGLYPDIAPDLFHTTELAYSFKACTPTNNHSNTPSPITLPKKTTYPSPQKREEFNFLNNSITSDHSQHQYRQDMKLPPIDFNRSVGNGGPFRLPLQDICLDRIPCSEDLRQLNTLSTTLSW